MPTSSKLPGNDHLPFAGQSEEVLDEIQRFLTGTTPVRVLDQVLLTVLFTDIVGSTEHLAQQGDRQ